MKKRREREAPISDQPIPTTAKPAHAPLIAVAARTPARHKPRTEEHSLRESDSGYRLLFESNACPMYILDDHTLDIIDVNEAALRESEARYHAIFEQAADAIVMFDPKTLAIVDFNDEASRRLGYSRRAFAKLKISDFEVSESTEEVKRHAQNVSMTGVEVFETKHRTKRGDVLDIEIRAKSVCVGGKTLVQGVWRDITARKKADWASQHRLALEELLAAASSRLVNVTMANLDEVVNEVLAEVGRLMGADRCHLFGVADDLATAHNTHEWCAPGIRAQIAGLRNVPTAVFPWMLERLRDGEPLSIPHVADIPPEAAAERQLMEKGQVQSAILVPIRHGGTLTGFIGCDAVRGERHWPDADARFLGIVGECLVDAQVRCQADEAVRSAQRGSGMAGDV